VSDLSQTATIKAGGDPCRKGGEMMVLTQKAEVIEKFLDRLTPNPEGRKGSIEKNLCTWCGGEATQFRNEISRREYRISGFCQVCQDKTFGKD
jgi:hypothetical protein